MCSSFSFFLQFSESHERFFLLYKALKCPSCSRKKRLLERKPRLFSFIMSYPFLSFFFLFKSCVDIFVVLPNIYLFITPPSVGSTSHRRQKSAARLINSTYPHSLCRSFIIISFFFYIATKIYYEKRKYYRACRALATDTRLACLTADARRPHHERRDFFFSFCV